jgi:hypothetical protein
LDLSFPGGEYYVKSSVDGDTYASVDEDGHLAVNGWSKGFKQMKASGGPAAPRERSIMLPGWHGGEVPSSFMFSMFHRWFVEKMREVNAMGVSVYNCTEGGAFIPGMDHRPLAELIATFTERALMNALQPFPFVSLLAQREIETAHSVALHSASSDRYLAASANLFDKLVSVLDYLEPLLATASTNLDAIGSDHEAA